MAATSAASMSSFPAKVLPFFKDDYALHRGLSLCLQECDKGSELADKLGFGAEFAAADRGRYHKQAEAEAFWMADKLGTSLVPLERVAAAAEAAGITKLKAHIDKMLRANCIPELKKIQPAMSWLTAQQRAAICEAVASSNDWANMAAYIAGSTSMASVITTAEALSKYILLVDVPLVWLYNSINELREPYLAEFVIAELRLEQAILKNEHTLPETDESLALAPDVNEQTVSLLTAVAEMKGLIETQTSYGLPLVGLDELLVELSGRSTAAKLAAVRRHVMPYHKGIDEFFELYEEHGANLNWLGSVLDKLLGAVEFTDPTVRGCVMLFRALFAREAQEYNDKIFEPLCRAAIALKALCDLAGGPKPPAAALHIRREPLLTLNDLTLAELDELARRIGRPLLYEYEVQKPNEGETEAAFRVRLADAVWARDVPAWRVHATVDRLMEVAREHKSDEHSALEYLTQLDAAYQIGTRATPGPVPLDHNVARVGADLAATLIDLHRIVFPTTGNYALPAFCRYIKRLALGSPDGRAELMGLVRLYVQPHHVKLAEIAQLSDPLSPHFAWFIRVLTQKAVIRSDFNTPKAGAPVSLDRLLYDEAMAHVAVWVSVLNGSQKHKSPLLALQIAHKLVDLARILAELCAIAKYELASTEALPVRPVFASELKPRDLTPSETRDWVAIVDFHRNLLEEIEKLGFKYNVTDHLKLHDLTAIDGKLTIMNLLCLHEKCWPDFHRILNMKHITDNGLNYEFVAHTRTLMALHATGEREQDRIDTALGPTGAKASRKTSDMDELSAPSVPSPKRMVTEPGVRSAASAAVVPLSDEAIDEALMHPQSSMP